MSESEQAKAEEGVNFAGEALGAGAAIATDLAPSNPIVATFATVITEIVAFLHLHFPGHAALPAMPAIPLGEQPPASTAASSPASGPHDPAPAIGAGGE